VCVREREKLIQTFSLEPPLVNHRLCPEVVKGLSDITHELDERRQIPCYAASMSKSDDNAMMIERNAAVDLVCTAPLLVDCPVDDDIDGDTQPALKVN